MKSPSNSTPNFENNYQPDNDNETRILYVLGCFFILTGISLLPTISGLSLICVGLVLTPLSYNFIKKVTRRNIAPPLRYSMVGILILISIGSHTPNKHNSEKQAAIIIDSSAAFNASNNKINHSDSAPVTTNPLNDDDSISRDSFLRDKALYEPTIEAQKSDVKTQNENFKRDYLSSWNGSCRTLVLYVKHTMNDPDSFEHIETVFRNAGDHAVVMMKFRGKNIYGGKVVNIVRANVSWDGEVLNVIEN